MSSKRDEKPPAGFQTVKVEIWEGVKKDKNQNKPVNKHKVNQKFIICFELD